MNKRKVSEKELDKIARKIRKLNKKLEVMAEESDSEGAEPVSNPVEDVPMPKKQIKKSPSQILLKKFSPMLNTPNGVKSKPLNKIEEIPKGPPVHEEIASRWMPILNKGLPESVKLDLIKKHIPFENIPVLSPRLNPELEAAVNERVKKRDSIIANRQKVMGAALVSVGKALQLFLQKGDYLEIVRNMNDAAKIICDSIQTDMSNRRSLIAFIFDKDMKDVLTGEAGSLLFGQNLPEHIKSNIEFQQLTQELKAASRSQKRTNWPARPNAHAEERPNQPGKQNKDKKLGQFQNKRKTHNIRGKNSGVHNSFISSYF